MFDIKLVDIAGDGVVVHFGTRFETLVETEILVKDTINQHLGIHCTELIHDENLVYSVQVNGRKIGVVVITSL